MPTNLYGPGDSYHPSNSHVIPGMIYRFHNAKIRNLSKVTLWGTGSPKREFLYVEDLAKASIYLMNINKKKIDNIVSPMCSHLNVGIGKDITIKELAEIIKKIVGFNGKINFDSSKPDGSPRKLMNSERINSLGFNHETNLWDGLVKTYEDFLKNHVND